METSELIIAKLKTLKRGQRFIYFIGMSGELYHDQRKILRVTHELLDLGKIEVYQKRTGTKGPFNEFAYIAVGA